MRFVLPAILLTYVACGGARTTENKAPAQPPADTPAAVCERVLATVSPELAAAGRALTAETRPRFLSRCVEKASEEQAEGEARWKCVSTCLSGAQHLKEAEACDQRCPPEPLTLTCESLLKAADIVRIAGKAPRSLESPASSSARCDTSFGLGDDIIVLHAIVHRTRGAALNSVRLPSNEPTTTHADPISGIGEKAIQYGAPFENRVKCDVIFAKARVSVHVAWTTSQSRCSFDRIDQLAGIVASRL